MQFVFEPRDPQEVRLREIAEKRLRFVMRRAASLLPRAKVHLSDLIGPRGDIDKRCRLQLTSKRAEPIVVISTAKDWRRAFEDALARASCVLARSLQRQRSVNPTSFGRKSAAFDPVAAVI